MSHRNLTVVDHPLTSHYMSVLRDKATQPEQFRETTRRLTYTLLMEATAGLEMVERPVETPMEGTTGRYLGRAIAAIAVLRAGLGLLDAVVDLMPEVSVGYAGVQRDEETALPHEYYTKLPPLHDAKVLVLEPMLATGGSLSWAVQKAKDHGAADVTALCVCVAPAGAERMAQDHPEVRIVTSALDEGLDHRYYIRPGLGDMGDRLFGTQ